MRSFDCGRFLLLLTIGTSTNVVAHVTHVHHWIVTVVVWRMGKRGRKWLVSNCHGLTLVCGLSERLVPGWSLQRARWWVGFLCHT